MSVTACTSPVLFLGLVMASLPAGAGAQSEPAGIRMFTESRKASIVPVSQMQQQDLVDPKRQALRVNEEAVALVLRGSVGQGLQKLKQAHLLDPHNPTVMYNLAGVYISEGKPSEALPMMEGAVNAQPNDIAFLHRLAQAYTLTGKTKQAVETYEKIALIDPLSESTLLKLGTLYGVTEQWDKAEATLRRAHQALGDDAQVLHSLGCILIVRGKYAEAIEVLTRAQSKVKDAKNSIALGIAYESLGRREKALQHYREAREFGERGDDLAVHIRELEKLTEPAAVRARN
ncbi:MAG TPA: tetratricopeptide repeat protein [Oligoflexia bacterium]|nr:tetratricopeptide repeat protein [Oligoflexia bacterium]